VRGPWQEMTQSLDITSIKDARIVEARELTSAAGRARLQKTQLEGEESIQWALEAHLLIEHIFYSAHVRQRAFLETLQAKGIACYAVRDGIMKKISDTTYLVPVIGIARLPPASERSGPAGDFVLVIDRVLDHGNLGTIIRTACAFGIRELISTTPDLDLSFNISVLSKLEQYHQPSSNGLQGDDTAKMVSRFPIAQDEHIIHLRFTKIARDGRFKENGILGFNKLVR
jgi:hypothetical protein